MVVCGMRGDGEGGRDREGKGEREGGKRETHEDGRGGLFTALEMHLVVGCSTEVLPHPTSRRAKYTIKFPHYRSSARFRLRLTCLV